MNKTLQTILSLTIISAVCAAILATVNDVTKTQIATLKARAVENAAKLVLPASVATVDAVADGLYAGRDANGKVVAYAVTGLDPHGFGGDIKLMVGFTPDFAIVTYQKLEATETPGLGTKLAAPEFMRQFKGKSARHDLKVAKDGGDIEAITSATITSRAVCGAVNQARARLQRHLSTTAK